MQEYGIWEPWVRVDCVQRRRVFKREGIFSSKKYKMFPESPYSFPESAFQNREVVGRTREGVTFLLISKIRGQNVPAQNILKI